ncbi:hypothetical protein EDD18DRAFT_64076 [Armillaria luteobubalina]|uniref:Uncharacterized protein n=1 Tax=Armillaria luteobubalina TaxID=153913 RepID=A0AA39QB98_9AGAR|nr:hypothetical protein EDD18DRAFT_64076 [Armillaria luteobubalina]
MVVYAVVRFIATCAMVLGFVVPLTAQEVRAIFRFVTRVFAHLVPTNVAFLRCLLIVVSLVISSHCSYSRASRVGASSRASTGIYGVPSKIANKRCSQSNGCTGGAWMYTTSMLPLQAVTLSVTAT